MQPVHNKERDMEKFLRQFLAVGVLAAMTLSTQAQEFPAKPIRIIVPTSVATTSDLTARFIAEQMSHELNVSVVVENKPGNSGIPGVTSFMAAPNDSYTLLVSYSGLYANAALYKKEVSPYDPVKDFRILAGANQVSLVLVANVGFKADTVRQLVALARQKPNEVTYASTGVGGSTHLGPELLANRAGIRLRHIPYNSGAQAVADVVGGHVNIAMTALPSAASLIAAGKLKALAVTGSHRSALMPDVPTLEEAGVPGAEVVSRQAIVARTGITDAAAAKLTAVIAKIVASPEYAKFLVANGIEKEPMPPDLYAKSGPDELRRWTEMVTLSGARAE
jgi:tripartite-type tricarboxylate transporter receptor subunit TctC